MAGAAVTFLLEKVTEVLKYHVDLISGAENELEQLKNELGLLKAFLQGAANKPKEEPLREWERQIRTVVHDAEDTIDSCLTQAAAEKGKLWPCLFGGVTHINLAKQVKSIRKQKVKPMFDKARRDFATDEGPSTTAEASWTKLSKGQTIRQDKIVGFKSEEDIIMNSLVEEKEELDVISIIGMPGLGKTTLAWQIYQNDDIQRQFPTRIWVDVSQEFNKREVFQDMLKEFTSEDMSRMTNQGLAMTVRAFLEKKKFLLVLDDIWSVDAWNDIKNVLPMSNASSKVLITSRHVDVGKHANVARDPHQLRPLNEKESWELLQLEVFGKLHSCPDKLAEIGKYTAKQCYGLPLALVVIGGILVDKGLIQSEWMNVSKNVNMFVRNDKLQRASNLIALSYNNFSDDLRDCFLYLGVFPQDYEIPAWTLTRLWIAEGFIQPNDGQSLEETAEEILKELINRNLVKVEKTSPNGEVKTCRVHDVVREFCKSRSAIEDLNLFQEIKKSKEGGFEPPLSKIQEYRRLCVHFNISDFLSQFRLGKLKGQRVRSFLCFNKENLLLDSKFTSTIPDAFNLLRVLDSKSVKFDQFSPMVTKRMHLRYVALSCENLSFLPESLSELLNLQTLIVDTKSRILEIRANIRKMIQLRHIKTKAAIRLLAIHGEGQGGEKLQTLSRLSPEHCTPDVLTRVRNLKQLGIHGKLAILIDGNFLVQLDRLETLKLQNDSSENRLPRVPLCNYFPPTIKRLTLSATCLDWSHISTLGMIGTLQVLKLKNKAFRGMSWKALGTGFPCLQFLLIDDTDLVFWEASGDHFPILGCLVLKNCEKLSKIPLGLAKSLQILNIESVTESAIESAKRIEAEKKQMQQQQQAAWGGFKLRIAPAGC